MTKLAAVGLKISLAAPQHTSPTAACSGMLYSLCSFWILLEVEFVASVFPAILQFCCGIDSIVSSMVEAEKEEKQTT